MSTATLDAKHDAVAGFVAATLQAMDEIAANPAIGLDAAIAAVPDLARTGRRRRRSSTRRSTSGRRRARPTPPARLARSTATGWQASIDYMTTLGLVPKPVTVDQLVTEEFLPTH